jgi:hypothetical protein
MSKNYHLGFSKQFVGFGIMLDTIPPYTHRKVSWTFEINLFWLRFWYVGYKKT